MTMRDVLRALAAYDKQYPQNDYPRSRPSQKSWLENDRYSHALEYKGRLYPPKMIFSLVTGERTAHFNTREALVAFGQVEDKGLKVVPKPGAVRRRSRP